MRPRLDTLLPVLAQATQSPDRKQTAWALWLMTLLLGVVLVASSAWLLARWRLRYGRSRGNHGKPRDTKALPDAWIEAGRRAEPATVDLDPPASGGDRNGGNGGRRRDPDHGTGPSRGEQPE